MTKEDVQAAMEIMQDCINKFDKRIRDKNKGLAAAIELRVTDGRELKAEIETDEKKIKAFKTALSALNEKLENTKEEYIAEKHLQTDSEPPPTTPGTYECPHCGTVYYRKPSICYNGCKRRLWET